MDYRDGYFELLKALEALEAQVEFDTDQPARTVRMEAALVQAHEALTRAANQPQRTPSAPAHPTRPALLTAVHKALKEGSDWFADDEGNYASYDCVDRMMATLQEAINPQGANPNDQ